jgi:S1-C subfamily serine protease
LKLPDVRQRFRDDAPGTVVAFSVTRGGKPAELKITLRDQI